MKQRFWAPSFLVFLGCVVNILPLTGFFRHPRLDLDPRAICFIQSIIVATLVYTTGSRQQSLLPRMHLLKTPAATYLQKRISWNSKLFIIIIIILFPCIFLHHKCGSIITITGSFSTILFVLKIPNLKEMSPTSCITKSGIYLLCCRTSCVGAQIISGKHFYTKLYSLYKHFKPPNAAEFLETHNHLFSSC